MTVGPFSPQSLVATLFICDRTYCYKIIIENHFTLNKVCDMVCPYMCWKNFVCKESAKHVCSTLQLQNIESGTHFGINEIIAIATSTVTFHVIQQFAYTYNVFITEWVWPFLFIPHICLIYLFNIFSSLFKCIGGFIQMLL